MQRLASIVEERIADILQLQQTAASLDRSQQNNQRHPTDRKKREIQLRIKQNKRITNELRLLEALQKEEHSQAEVRKTLADIMKQYDPTYTPKEGSDSVGGAASTSRLLAEFVGRNSHPQCQQLSKNIENNRRNVRNYEFVLWLSEWSKIVLLSLLQSHRNSGSNRAYATIVQRQQSLVDSERKVERKIQSIPSLRKNKTEQCQGKSLRPDSANKLTFHCRQHLYGLIKSQLTSVYRLHDCLDLDLDYMIRVPRTAKKSSQKDALQIIVQFLLKNCSSHTGIAISSYCQQYKQAMPGFVEEGKRSIELSEAQQTAQNRKTKTAINFHSHISNAVKPNRKTQVLSLHKQLVTIQQQPPLSKNTVLCISKSVSASKMERSSPKIPSVSNPERQQDYQYNFIRKKDKKTKRDMFKQLNCTFLLARSSRKTVSRSHQQNKSLLATQQIEQQQMLSATVEEIGKGKTNWTSTIVGLQYSKEMFNDSRLNREQLRLKAKKSAMLMAREAVLLSQQQRPH